MHWSRFYFDFHQMSAGLRLVQRAEGVECDSVEVYLLFSFFGFFSFFTFFGCSFSDPDLATAEVA